MSDAPPIPQTVEQKIESLAAICCTEEQIAAFLGMEKDELISRYMKNIEAGWEKGRIQLRQWQFNLAKNGDPDMLKFLGKQYLGQN